MEQLEILEWAIKGVVYQMNMLEDQHAPAAEIEALRRELIVLTKLSYTEKENSNKIR